MEKTISDIEWRRIAKALEVNKESIYENYKLITINKNLVKIPIKTNNESDTISLENFKSPSPETSTNQSFNIPRQLLENDLEYITILKSENKNSIIKRKVRKTK